MEKQEAKDKTVCTQYATCPLIKHFETANGGKIMKVIFCDNKYERCARYQLSSVGRAVPENMLPDGNYLALG